MGAHPNLECRMYEARYPAVDMAVMIQVKNIADMGAYVSLLEYNNTKLVHSIMRHVAETLNIDLEELYVHIGWPLYRKYGHASEFWILSRVKSRRLTLMGRR